jgi:hypothetical protein
MQNFQRIDAISNAHVGNEFEEISKQFFETQGLRLTRNFSLPVGVGDLKKAHRFDLGSNEPPALVECKSHTWTGTGNVPSAKITVWNEAMYYFYLAPKTYRKIFFALKHSRNDETLVEYYLRNYRHLVPAGVEFWKYCALEKHGHQIL